MIRFKTSFIEQELIWDEQKCINSLVIESPSCLRRVIRDICRDLDSVNYFTDDGKAMNSKFVDFIANPLNLEFNNKKAITTLMKILVKQSTSEDFYSSTNLFKTMIIKYLDTLIEAENYKFNIEVDLDFSIDSIAKAVNLRITENDDNFVGLLVDYLDMMVELAETKIFIFLNLSALLEEKEMEDFILEIRNRQINLLLVESQAKILGRNISRLIIDKDMCEI